MLLKTYDVQQVHCFSTWMIIPHKLTILMCVHFEWRWFCVVKQTVRIQVNVSVCVCMWCSHRSGKSWNERWELKWMQWQKTKAAWTAHTIRIRKMNIKLTSGWKKEGIGRIKCLIYDEVAQTRIKYLHIPITHSTIVRQRENEREKEREQTGTRDIAKNADSVVFKFCIAMHFQSLCAMFYVLGIYCLYSLSLQFESMWNAYQNRHYFCLSLSFSLSNYLSPSLLSGFPSSQIEFNWIAFYFNHLQTMANPEDE